MAPAMALAQWALVFVRLAAAESAADFVDQLLERMTLEEKAGQLGVFARPGGSDFNPGSHTKDWNETLQKVRAGQVSAFFNGEGVKVNRELQRVAVEESRLGIPLIFGADIWHGMWTIFPIPLAEAASFEPELARRTARATAVEATRAGLMWTFAPMVDVSRDQRWGRTAEGAGEDPLLGARFARARVQGFQGPNLKAEDSLAACLKHFAGYGGVEAGLDYSQSDMSEATFRDVHLPPFIAGIEAGALTVMSAFIALMGVPATGNRWLLTKVLRQELGFNGFVVTDYEADKELVNHGFAADASDAARLSLTAGSDMSMQSGIYRDHLPDLTTQGTVPQATLDEAVRRVLHAKLSMGLFANPYRSLTLGRETLPAELVEQHDSLAREASRKSVVLLRNEHSLLPLKRGQRIGIVGWWGNDTADTDGVGVLWGNKSHSLSLLDGMTAAVDPSLLRFEPGSGVETPLEGGLARAVEVAHWADVVIFAVGESSSMAGESRSRTNILIPEAQQALVDAVAAVGKPSVVLLKAQRALELRGAVRDAPAIMVAWFLGKMTGPALADVILGEFSPSGRLPVSFPIKGGQAPFHYNHMSSGRPCAWGSSFTNCWQDAPNRALYPFGHGLTYSQVVYGAVSVRPKFLPWDMPRGFLWITCSVTNAGNRTVDEVAQLYIRDKVASRVRPIRELKDFHKLKLRPGEVQVVSFTLSREQLQFADVHSGLYTVEPGLFDVWVAPSSAEGQAVQFELGPVETWM